MGWSENNPCSSSASSILVVISVICFHFYVTIWHWPNSHRVPLFYSRAVVICLIARTLTLFFRGNFLYTRCRSSLVCSYLTLFWGGNLLVYILLCFQHPGVFRPFLTLTSVLHQKDRSKTINKQTTSTIPYGHS